MRIEVGDRRHARQDEGSRPRKQADDKENAADQFDDTGCPLIVIGDALFMGPAGKFRYLVVPC